MNIAGDDDTNMSSIRVRAIIGYLLVWIDGMFAAKNMFL